MAALSFFTACVLAVESPATRDVLLPQDLTPGHHRLLHTTTLRMTPERRANSLKEVQQAVSEGLLPARVIGVGLPHTGTTTLDEMLTTQLGCQFSTHNLHSSDLQALKWTWSVTGGSKCEESASECEQALVEEARHFQCLSDDPWSSHWRALIADDPSAIVVLTRSQTALHYAITVKQWLNRTRWHHNLLTKLLFGDPANLTHAMQAYDAHNQAVREALADNPNFVELCVQCGEDVRTLARRLHVRNMTTTLRRLSTNATLSKDHENGHPMWESEERRRLFAEFSGALVS